LPKHHVFENFKRWMKLSPSPRQEKRDGVSEIYTVYSDISCLLLPGIHLGLFQ